MSVLESRVRVGIDIGGTFTDFVVIDEGTGEVQLEKTLTTPRDLWQGIMRGLEKARVDMPNTALVAHGTTVGLNAFLERKGSKTGLITTRGFRDVYEIGRHNRVEMYDLFYQKPKPLVPREHRLEVRERLDAQGNVLVPLVEEDVITAIAHFRRHDIKSIAVVLLHAYANPTHEVRIGEIIAREYPEAEVSLSHALAREWREYERTSTTVINAFIMPVVGRYLNRVEEQLGSLGYRRPFFVNQSSGGIMSVASARTKPVQTIMSGPAGGAVSAAYVGKAAGFDNVISFDMGGTSTDVALTYQGHTRVSVESKIEGHPLMVPMVDIHSIGAGGGSIAWIDNTGALNVGPQSAGAEPGPVCYGRGGEQPTVTDANLILGRLRPAILGGTMTLDLEAAKRATAEKVAKPLGLTTDEAAGGIIRIVNTKMAYAIRAITVERGLDPKDFVLLAFGGAGPMHACDLAAELEIPKVIVPVAPGAFSALGMLLSDARHDYVRTFLTPTSGADPQVMEAQFGEMESEALRTLAEEVPGAPTRFERYVDMRYVGQEYTVKVPVPASKITGELLAELRSTFDRLHDQAYGHASETEPIEIINLRVVAFGVVPDVELKEIPSGGSEPPAEALAGTIQSLFDPAKGCVECRIYEREKLLAGNRISGPALVVEKGATTVLNPGFELEVTRHGNLLITREG